MAGWAGDPAVLMLTTTAAEGHAAIEEAVEPTLAGDGELAPLADWGGKYVGAVARIAGILHLAEHGPEAGPRSPVTAQHHPRPPRIGDYFKACAINAFTEMGTDHVIADAVYLLDRIERLGADEVSERDLSRGSRVQVPDQGRHGARAGPARRSRLPGPDAREKPTGGRPASRATKSTPTRQKPHNIQKGDFCMFRLFCQDLKERKQRNDNNSHQKDLAVPRGLGSRRTCPRGVHDRARRQRLGLRRRQSADLQHQGMGRHRPRQRKAETMTKQARRGWRQARSDTIASTAKTRRDKPGRSGIPDHIDPAEKLAPVSRREK